MLTIIENCFYDDNVWKMNKIECNFLENAKNDFTKNEKGVTNIKQFYKHFIWVALYLFI